MASESSEHELASSVVIAAVYAAAGGALPTLCRLAPIGFDGNVEALFRFGHLVALLIYSLIGFIVCLGFRERKYRQAFILGIAAPGLITNILAGSGAAAQQSSASTVNVSIFSIAHADVAPKESSGGSEFWLDLKRGLGFSIPIASDRSLNITEFETSSEIGMDINELSEELRLGGEPIPELGHSDHPAFGGQGRSLPVDVWVGSSYLRFRSFLSSSTELAMIDSGNVNLFGFSGPVPPESICTLKQARDFKGAALTAFDVSSIHSHPSLESILDMVNLANESVFRARLASALSELGGEAGLESSSCDSAAGVYIETAEWLYDTLINRVDR